MRTLHYLKRGLALLFLGLCTAACVEGTDFSEALPFQTVGMEGRSVIIAAGYTTGSVQWQVRIPGDSTWNKVGDDQTYRGSSTPLLEITETKAALDGFSYRFTNTTPEGMVATSNATKLVVSPTLFPQPAGLILDGAGGLYVSDASTHTIRRIANADWYGWGNITDLHGTPLFCQVSVVAGVAGQTGAVDGAAGGALFNQPRGLVSIAGANALDLAVADTANGIIRRIGGSPVNVTTLAGSSTLRGNVDGPGAMALFSTPMTVVPAPGNAFYVSDSANHTIRKVAADGTVSTFAGSPGNAGWVDGTGSAARFNNPTGLAVDGAGALYVADTTNNLIRKITPEGVVTTLAGTAGVSGAQDGSGRQALFNGPTGLAQAGTGIFVADTGNSTIRLVSGDGKVTTFAGVAGVAGLRDTSSGTWDTVRGYYYPALFNQPQALAWENGTGLLFVADSGNGAIRVISLYDGWTLTLPLTEAPTSYFFPSNTTPQVPVTTTVTTVPAPTSPPATSGNTASSGGGGAPSGWFLTALAGAALFRKWQRRAG